MAKNLLTMKPWSLMTPFYIFFGLINNVMVLMEKHNVVVGTYKDIKIKEESLGITLILGFH